MNKIMIYCKMDVVYMVTQNLIFDIEEKANEICKLITEKYIGKEGLVLASYNIDGTIKDRHLTIQDFGDFFPFLLYFDHIDFVDKQIEISSSHLWKGLYVENGLILPPKNHDYLFGLIEYYKTTKDQKMLDLLEEKMSNFVKYLMKDNMVCNYFYPKYRLRIPVSDPITGGFIELFLEMYELTKDDRYLNIAQNTAYAWLNNDFFKIFGLFPSKNVINSEFLSKLYRKIHPNPIVTMFKTNTNLMYSIVMLYRITNNSIYKEAILKWVDSIKTNMFDEAIYSHWSPDKGKQKVELLMNFPVLDLLCDIYYFVENSKDILDFANKIAKFWISHQFPLGLFPNSPFENRDNLDCQTDFMIALMKLYELSDNKIYKASVDKCFNAVIDYHYTINGYVLSVNKKGDIVDSTISTKYNALLLKPFILYIENKKIYEDTYLYDIVKDR